MSFPCLVRDGYIYMYFRGPRPFHAMLAHVYLLLQGRGLFSCFVASFGKFPLVEVSRGVPWSWVLQ